MIETAENEYNELTRKREVTESTNSSLQRLHSLGHSERQGEN